MSKSPISGEAGNRRAPGAEQDNSDDGGQGEAADDEAAEPPAPWEEAEGFPGSGGLAAEGIVPFDLGTAAVQAAKR